MILDAKRLVLAAIPFVLIACSSDPEQQPPPPKPEVSYWQDVAPIVFERCVQCHQEGGIAPFRLDRYEDAKIYAAAAALAVKERTMPPYLVTADGSCGSFDEPPVLTDAEIATIERWAEIGAPEGDEVQIEVPPIARLEEGEIFSTPTFLPEIQGGAIAEFDEYRCFYLDEPFDRERFVTGYEVIPGNEPMIHHVIVFNVDPNAPGQGGTNGELMEALDAESPDRDGWPCFGFAGEGVQIDSSPVNWAPGQGAVEYPAGTGLRMRAGTRMIVQVHYNLFDPALRGQSDRTEVKIRFADQVDRAGINLLPDGFLATLFFGNPAQLEPGKERVPYTWKSTLREFGVRGAYEIYGVVPHMHQRGRSLELRVGPEDTATCAARVDRWDFHWQRVYFYDDPIALDDTTPFSVTCEFDTSDRTEPVLPGWGTHNEMCLAVLYLVEAQSP
jgi:hypothetical protein